MHAYIIIRGIKPRVEQYVNDCLAQYYNYKSQFKEEDAVQLSMRPIQLYEVVFPEPEMMKVLRTIRPNNEGGFKGAGMSSFLAATLRKLLRLKPFPQDKEIMKGKVMYPMSKNDIDIVGIGIKKDIYKDEIEQL